jgi:hypothetical protein
MKKRQLLAVAFIEERAIAAIRAIGRSSPLPSFLYLQDSCGRL